MPAQTSPESIARYPGRLQFDESSRADPNVIPPPHFPKPAGLRDPNPLYRCPEPQREPHPQFGGSPCDWRLKGAAYSALSNATKTGTALHERDCRVLAGSKSSL